MTAVSVAIGAPGVVEAVREFLEDGAHGGVDSPANTLNQTLAAVRTSLGLDAGTGTDGARVNLPDVVAFDTWYAVGEYGQEYPRLGIVWTGHSGEEEARNQQRFTHRIELVLVVPAADLDPSAGSAFGEAEASMYALGLYDLALMSMFLRRPSNAAEYGKDLNGGGTGTAANKITLARYDGVRDIAAFGEEHSPMLAMTCDLLVRIVENL